MAIWNKLTRLGSRHARRSASDDQRDTAMTVSDARSTGRSYQIERLVDARVRELSEATQGGPHIICDIDKTYLETEFESVVRMVRIAFEAATDKVTVTGASDVLQCARWGDFHGCASSASALNSPNAAVSDLTEGFPRALHFVSSSPPQLRSVLEEKLMLDGLDWTSDTFKNQAYNIRMGRMDLLRQHVGYKSLAILQRVRAAGPQARFYMIGDNAETDAYIYLGIKLFLEGRLSQQAYVEYLAIAGVEKSLIAGVRARLEAGRDIFAHEPRVAAILIRSVPGYKFVATTPLTACVETFDNFYQVALRLTAHGIIPLECLWGVTRNMHNLHGFSPNQLCDELQAHKVLFAEGSAAIACVESVIERLQYTGAGHAKEIPTVVQTPAAQAYAQLSEAEILQYAEQWMREIHRLRQKT